MVTWVKLKGLSFLLPRHNAKHVVLDFKTGVLSLPVSDQTTHIVPAVVRHRSERASWRLTQDNKFESREKVIIIIENFLDTNICKYIYITFEIATNLAKIKIFMIIMIKTPSRYICIDTEMILCSQMCLKWLYILLLQCKIISVNDRLEGTPFCSSK